MEINVDETLREDYVSICDKDDNLIVRSCNPLVIYNVRLQILEKELEGYYALGEDGTRVDIDIRKNPTRFPFQHAVADLSLVLLKMLGEKHRKTMQKDDAEDYIVGANVDESLILS